MQRTARVGLPLLGAYGLLGIALFLDNGGLGPGSLPLVIAACVLTARELLGRTWWAGRWPTLDVPRVVAAILVADAACAWLKAPGVYLADAGIGARLCETVAALGAAWLAVTPRRVPGKLLLAALVALVAAAGVLVLLGSPAPIIDVFTLQQEGARDLWHGLDPYRSLFTNPYTPEQTLTFFGAPHAQLTNYPYPPASLVWSSLGWRLAGDVRAAYLVAQLATGAGLYALARKFGRPPGLAVAFAALLLVHPRGLFLLEQSWTEPLICAAFVAVLLTLEKRVSLVLALGVFFAAKQYSVLLLPLFVARRLSITPHRHSGIPRIALVLGLVLAAAITVPFALWDLPAFVDDVVLFQVGQPFRWNALSIAPAIAYVTGWKTGALGPLALLGTLGLGWRRAPRGTYGLCVMAAAVLLAFFVFAKQAFCNYYYFASVILLCAAITATEQRDDGPRE